MKTAVIRVSALLLAVSMLLAFSPSADAAEPYSGFSKNIIEQYYNVEIKIDMRTKWAKKLDRVYNSALEGLKAFPEGLLSQAFEFYELEHGERFQILYRAKRASDPANAAAFFRYASNQIVMLEDSNRLTENVIHELSHMVHYYLLYYYGGTAADEVLQTEPYVTEYARTSYMEDFAETVTYMYFNREAVHKAMRENAPIAQKYKAVGYALTSRASTQSLGLFDGFFANNFTYLGFFKTYGTGTDEWLKGEVLAAAEAGLIPAEDFLLGGYELPLTRLEFSYIAARLMERCGGKTMMALGEACGAKKVTMYSRLPFSDIDTVDRFDAIINLYYMKELGILSGEEFFPDEYISLEDALGMLSKIAEIFGVTIEPCETESVLTRDRAVRLSYEVYSQLMLSKKAA